MSNRIKGLILILVCLSAINAFIGLISSYGFLYTFLRAFAFEGLVILLFGIGLGLIFGLMLVFEGEDW